MATHSSILAREIPWTEDPGGLQSKGSQGVRHGSATKQHIYTCVCVCVCVCVYLLIFCCILVVHAILAP